jgi:hypothetical protein
LTEAKQQSVTGLPLPHSPKPSITTASKQAPEQAHDFQQRRVFGVIFVD